MLTLVTGLYLSGYRLSSGTSMPFWSGKDYLQITHGLEVHMFRCQ